jgi:iron-sulfur cluster assembly protein
MAVTMTERAARHVAGFLERRGKGMGLRLGVRTTGCSGMAYKLEYADEAEPDDLVFESQGLQVIVDPKSLPYIDGTELDFAREGLNEGFKFNNPEREERVRLRRKLQRLIKGRGCRAFSLALPGMSHPDHFELFGLPPRFKIDPDALERAYKDVQSRVHPDRFAAGTAAERRVAMQWGHACQ